MTRRDPGDPTNLLEALAAPRALEPRQGIVPVETDADGRSRHPARRGLIVVADKGMRG